MEQPKALPNKVLRILNDQRKTGQFCDITIKLSNDFQVWAHFCVLAPQSDFVGDKYFLQKDMQFSIHNPLKIEIFNYECEECLCDLMDLVYCNEEVVIFGEHEEHMKTLTKMLSIDDPNMLKGAVAMVTTVSSESVAHKDIKFQVKCTQRKSTSYQYK